MLFKLSLKNIKRSIKDYSIYFFTLVFAVAMFYMFNSIDAQSSMLVLNESKREIVQSLVGLISYVSIFVSVVLGFLIVYSNNFLIKRRKKEIGLYFTLGMSKKRVSMIIVIETIFIGVISLIVGLLFGTILSQFLSLLTAKLFEVDLTNFKFIFSSTAFNKTILYFGIIFILVMIFNVITLSRYKLIDLINATKKNEQIKIRNKYVTIISFILSIIMIGYAYYLLFNNALVMMDYRTALMLILGALGTFLLFFSLSGFLLKMFQKSKKIYYKNLNLFILRQVNSRINTTVISTSVICLMLLLTIGILSGSLSLANVFNKDIKENNLTDFTVTSYSSDDYNYDPDEIKINNNAYVSDFEKFITNSELQNYTDDYAVVHRYIDKSLKFTQMMTQNDIDKLKKEYGAALSLEGYPIIISETEYQKLMKVLNKDVIDIKDNEYLLMANIDFIMNAYEEHYTNKIGIEVNGIKLTPATDKIIKTAIENYNSAGNDGLIVVSDNLIKNLSLERIVMIGNYVKTDIKENIEPKFESFVREEVKGAYSFRTRIGMEESSIGLKCIMIFMGLYLGITFAISSATVLAIGELSQSSDNKNRYKILKQLGADNKMINKSLFTGILISFIFPLIVALIHSYFGLKEINSLIIVIGDIDLTSNIILTTLFMLIIYGGYFFITYLCSKSIIKENN